MRNFQILTVAGMVLTLGFGSTLMAQKSQASRNEVRVSWTENRPQARLLFVDENGDGICDQLRDHDGDGIPNSQDPDWERPEDGSGFKNGQGGQQDRGAFANRNAFRGQNGSGLNNRSFRNQAGNSICDGAGPKGNGNRRGGK